MVTLCREMKIITHTGMHLILSTKCDHAERWPDGFCIRCAALEEEVPKDKLARLALEASLDERVLELFPSVRFIQCSGFLVKDEGEV
jgi:hypothetical protein